MDVGSASESSADWSLVPVLEPLVVQVQMSRSLCSLGLEQLIDTLRPSSQTLDLALLLTLRCVLWALFGLSAPLASTQQF